MAGAVPSRSRKRDFLALFGAALLPLPWMLAHEFPGLGLQPEMVAVLSGFVDPPWRRPVDGLAEADKAFVLGEAGFLSCQFGAHLR